MRTRLAALLCCTALLVAVPAHSGEIDHLLGNGPTSHAVCRHILQPTRLDRPDNTYACPNGIGVAATVASKKKKDSDLKIIMDQLNDIIAEYRDVRPYSNNLRNIRQRTKVRQVNGIVNINVMEWTTQSNNTPDMEGVVVFLKDFKGLYSPIDKQMRIFMKYLPRNWKSYGNFAEIAKKIFGDDIGFINYFIVRFYLWFREHKKFIGNQGGIIAFYGPNDSAELVIYADKNIYKDHNVTGFLTSKSKLNKLELSGDVFIVKRGRRDFQELVFENKNGPVGIEVPYILHRIK